MEKIFSKKMVALACGAVLAFGGLALAAHGALTANAEEPQPENQIILDAGQGTFDGSSNKTNVTLSNDGKLPALPAPVREGWEFVGWFDQVVIENFWGDGAEENTDSTQDYKKLKATYGTAQGYQNILYQGAVTSVAALDSASDSGWKELIFNWICVTKGNQVQAGESAECGTTLYAMYQAERYTVYWHLNGWQNSYEVSATANTAHRTMPEHDGYFVDYELDSFPSLAWKNHSFLGWYTSPDCTEEYPFEQVGIYKINETPITGDLHLYAKWEASAEFDGEIRVNKPMNLLEPKLNETFTVSCSYTLGESRDMPVITGWESSEPDAVVFVSDDPSSASAVFRFQNTKIFEGGNKHVSIYVTVDGKQYVAADITVGHSWGKVVSEKQPTCTEAGYTVYGCKFCTETKTVTHAANGHRFTYKNNPATCTEDASVERYCIVCGLGGTEILENTKLGHSWKTYTVADCNGTSTTTTCVTCGLSNTTTDRNAVVHNWNLQYTIDKAATCTLEGIKSIYCKGCGAVKESVPIPATGHKYSTKTVPATCTQSGSVTKTCTNCGDTVVESMLPAKGHSYNTKTTPATCTQSGSVTKTCATCNDSFVENVIPATGHDVVTSKTVGCGGAVITTETCKKCDYKNVIGDVTLAEHAWETNYTVDREADCKNEGAMSVHCRKCDATKEVTAIPVTEAHVWGEWSVAQETADTQTLIRSCEVCGKTETQTQNMPAAPSQPEQEPVPELPEQEPEVELPETEAPEVVEPEVEAPEIQLPEIEEPQIEEPEVAEPEVELPEVEAPDIAEPEAEEVVIEQPEKVEEPKHENGSLTLSAQNAAPAHQTAGEADSAWLWIAIAIALCAVALVSVSAIVFVKRR